MRKKHHQWAVPLAGMVLFGTAVSAEQDKYTYLNSTNRVTLSLRFGLNISGKFSGFGGGISTPGSALGNGQRTPDGDPYNYDNGYVLTDSTGNALGFTTYWGYNTLSQYDPVADTISFNRSTATGVSAAGSGDNNDPSPGFELTYDRQLGEKENWHHLRYGIEGAVNYFGIAMNDSSASGAILTTLTDVYQVAGAPTPPPLPPPYQGPFNDPSSAHDLQVPFISETSSSSGGTFMSQDHFNGSLWGFRLGPYLEYPVTEKWSWHLSGGLALGLLYGSDSWQQTLAMPGSSATASGGGNAFDTLWGYYVSLNASYQINKRWGVEGGVEYQDIGQYNHSFQGRQVGLDLSRSLFVQVGISYSF